MECTEIRINRKELLDALNFFDHLKAQGIDASEDMKFIRTDGSGIGYTLEVETFANIAGVGVEIRTGITTVDNW